MSADEKDPEPPGQTLPLPSDADGPALAREFISEHANGLSPELLDDALLLVSELVTNAVRYGEPEIVLHVRHDPPGIGVSVHDAGPELPQLTDTPPDPAKQGGRGLRIVDALAQRWGVSRTRRQPGKTVWFELGLA
jgi:anti-sigma regulatory factor (Ser/Thr protein kinase)